MPEDKSAVEDFLGGLNKEEKDPFKSSDPFAEMNEDTKDEVVEETVEDAEEEKPLPFHKDPKVQKYVDKQIAKALEGVRPSQVQEFKEAVSEDTDDLVSAFTAIIGNDTPEKQHALKLLDKTLKQVDQRAAEKALEGISKREQAQLEEDRRAQTELDESFDEIEDSFSVDLSSNAPSAKKMRSDFVDYIRKIAPKNEEGEVTAFPDLNAAFEEFQAKSKRVPQNATRAKQLSSRSMSNSTDATVAPKATGTSWKDVDRMFNNLQ